MSSRQRLRVSGYRSQPVSNRTSMYSTADFTKSNGVNDLTDFDKQFKKLLERTENFTNRVERIQDTTTAYALKGYRRIGNPNGLRGHRDYSFGNAAPTEPTANYDETTEEEWKRLLDAGKLVERAVELVRKRYRHPKSLFQYSPESPSPRAYDVPAGTVLVPNPPSPRDKYGRRIPDPGSDIKFLHEKKEKRLSALTESDERGSRGSRSKASIHSSKTSSFDKAGKKSDSRLSSKSASFDSSGINKSERNSALIVADKDEGKMPNGCNVANIPSKRLSGDFTRSIFGDPLADRYSSVKSNEKIDDENVSKDSKNSSSLNTLKNATSRSKRRPPTMYGEFIISESDESVRNSLQLSDSNDSDALDRKMAQIFPEDIHECTNAELIRRAREERENQKADKPSKVDERKRSDAPSKVKKILTSSFHEYNPSNRVPLRDRLKQREDEDEDRSSKGSNEKNPKEETPSFTSRFLRRFRSTDEKTKDKKDVNEKEKKREEPREEPSTSSSRNYKQDTERSNNNEDMPYSTSLFRTYATKDFLDDKESESPKSREHRDTSISSSTRKYQSDWRKSREYLDTSLSPPLRAYQSEWRKSREFLDAPISSTPRTYQSEWRKSRESLLDSSITTSARIYQKDNERSNTDNNLEVIGSSIFDRTSPPTIRRSSNYALKDAEMSDSPRSLRRSSYSRRRDSEISDSSRSTKKSPYLTRREAELSDTSAGYLSKSPISEIEDEKSIYGRKFTSKDDDSSATYASKEISLFDRIDENSATATEGDKSIAKSPSSIQRSSHIATKDAEMSDSPRSLRRSSYSRRRDSEISDSSISSKKSPYLSRRDADLSDSSSRYRRKSPRSQQEDENIMSGRFFTRKDEDSSARHIPKENSLFNRIDENNTEGIERNSEAAVVAKSKDNDEKIMKNIEPTEVNPLHVLEDVIQPVTKREGSINLDFKSPRTSATNEILEEISEVILQKDKSLDDNLFDVLMERQVSEEILQPNLQRQMSFDDALFQKVYELSSNRSSYADSIKNGDKKISSRSFSIQEEPDDITEAEEGQNNAAKIETNDATDKPVDIKEDSGEKCNATDTLEESKVSSEMHEASNKVLEEKEHEQKRKTSQIHQLLDDIEKANDEMYNKLMNLTKPRSVNEVSEELRIPEKEHNGIYSEVQEDHSVTVSKLERCISSDGTAVPDELTENNEAHTEESINSGKNMKNVIARHNIDRSSPIKRLSYIQKRESHMNLFENQLTFSTDDISLGSEKETETSKCDLSCNAKNENGNDSRLEDSLDRRANSWNGNGNSSSDNPDMNLSNEDGPSSPLAEASLENRSSVGRQSLDDIKKRISEIRVRRKLIAKKSFDYLSKSEGEKSDESAHRIDEEPGSSSEEDELARAHGDGVTVLKESLKSNTEEEDVFRRAEKLSDDEALQKTTRTKEEAEIDLNKNCEQLLSKDTSSGEFAEIIDKKENILLKDDEQEKCSQKSSDADLEEAGNFTHTTEEEMHKLQSSDSYHSSEQADLDKTLENDDQLEATVIANDKCTSADLSKKDENTKSNVTSILRKSSNKVPRDEISIVEYRRRKLERGESGNSTSYYSDEESFFYKTDNDKTDNDKEGRSSIDDVSDTSVDYSHRKKRYSRNKKDMKTCDDQSSTSESEILEPYLSNSIVDMLAFRYSTQPRPETDKEKADNLAMPGTSHRKPSFTQMFNQAYQAPSESSI